MNISVSAEGKHTTGTILAMCRETCQDFGTSCGVHLGEAFSNILYCKHFHYKEHSNTCFYQQVFCDKPDLITNGGYNIIHGNASFSATTTIEYLCNEGYTLEGAQNSTCLLSGDWSSKSQCTSTLNDLNSNLTMRNALLFNGTPLLTMLVCFSAITFIVLKRHGRSKKHIANINLPKRNKENDAFVSYYSEDSCPEQTFVRKVLSPKLELEQEDPFKLIIHERDFRAGTNIVTNIMNAIHNSNSAIILLSQDYVNSRWCRDEFEWCVEERKKDHAFERYVILMEPDRELEGLSDYMEQYLSSITYLKVTDPELLGKIIDELSKMRSDECVEKIDTYKCKEKSAGMARCFAKRFRDEIWFMIIALKKLKAIPFKNQGSVGRNFCAPITFKRLSR